MKDIWYKVLSKCLGYSDTETQLEEIPTAVDLLKQGIAECNPKNYKLLITIIGHISDELLANILDEELCTRILRIIIQMMNTLDKEENINAISAIGRMCESADGRTAIKSNRTIIDFVKKALVNNDFADAAAETYYDFIMSGKYKDKGLEFDNEILKEFLPGLVSYSKRKSAIARQNYKDIMAELKEMG